MAYYDERLAEERHSQIMALLDEIRSEARATNGRLRTVEDRTTRLEERSPGKLAGVAGLIGGAIAGGLAWFSRP